jgi:hypothetical protein
MQRAFKSNVIYDMLHMHGEQAMSLPTLLDMCGQMVLRLSRPHCDGLFILDAQRRKLVQYDPL